MPKYYTDLLASLSRRSTTDRGKDLIRFEEGVLRRYRDDEGPWRLHKTDITFYQWVDEEPGRMLTLPLAHGGGEVSVVLRDLAALPRSEQEHWRRFQTTP